MAATMRTDIGRKRKQNEDAAWFDEKRGVFVVADGMGGHLAGEVASQMAIDAVRRMAARHKKPSVDLLKETVLGAHERIYLHAQGHAECAGMGTTISMMWRGGGYMYIAHVGDSRIYRLRDGHMEQITQDHSLVGELVRAGLLTPEEARLHPRRNIITRALGTEGDNTPDLLAADIRPGDCFLLCTDGLTGMVRDDDIERTLLDSKTIDQAANRLVEMALDAGGSDNVTLILCTGEEGQTVETRLIGKIISRRFRVEDIIGRGGMAIVYRAFDLKTHQTVAIKVLREEYAEDPEYKERFRREGEVCRKLSHPNVVNLIDAGEVGDVSYLAMEYVDGQTLKELITQTGGIAQEDAVRFTLQILAALGHAHQRGIIHRDVKPQNVMVSRAGQVKVGDFGIAGMADTKTLTTDGNVMGSVHYFSPEQAKGMRATEASDLYSVGVILYEMLCGHVPFEGETAVSVAMMHLMEPPKPIEEQAKVSPAVAMIVAKSLQKLPQQRYQSADAMARDLRRALRHPDGGFMQQHHPAIIEESHEVVERSAKRKSPAACPRVC
ncbi:MAG: Stp1/IreP family PP2C-type Ser/Thr phosphatase [Christensenellales bacterium]